MATATTTITVNSYPLGFDQGQRYIYVYGTVSIAASPDTYATGGLALDFTTVTTSPDGQLLPVTPTDLAAPVEVYFSSVAVGGFLYLWNKANNKLQIGAASGGTAGTGAVYEEMSNGTAIPSAISGDTIAFKATFVRMRG